MEEDSLKLRYTVTNMGDLEEQLYQLWVQLNYLIREYCPHCPTVSIIKYIYTIYIYIYDNLFL